jgi:hypothetical protein
MLDKKTTAIVEKKKRRKRKRSEVLGNHVMMHLIRTTSWKKRTRIHVII